MLRAMEESGWFVPIEREGLANLLNERKIIRSSRATFQGGNQQTLPPLLFGGIIIEGGIVSFDTNLRTGGIGIRYFGTGGSSQYREDRVTIYLRAISTSNGKILKTVYTSKTILSQQIDAGTFRFVRPSKLLEAETGFTFNEPGEMAVKEAIEKAVVGLVIEGLEDNLWQSIDEAPLSNAVVQEYMDERSQKDSLNVFGITNNVQRGRIAISPGVGSYLYSGDFGDSRLYPSAELSFEYLGRLPVAINANFGIGRLGTSDGFKGNIAHFEVLGNYRFFKTTTYTPFVKFGGGFIQELSNNIKDEVVFFDDYHVHLVGEMGLEYMVAERFGLSLALNSRYLLSEDLDTIDQGKFNDFIWGGRLGVSIYLR